MNRRRLALTVARKIILMSVPFLVNRRIKSLEGLEGGVNYANL